MNAATCDTYAAALEAGGCGVCREDPVGIETASELEIQARWFAGEFGTSWLTEDGREVEVLHFGRWNREAGPDFVEVRLRFTDGVTKTGSVEIDRDARDWEAHGHATNPAFRNTVLHLFLRRPSARFFTRNCDHLEIPQALLSTERSSSERRAPSVSRMFSVDPEQARQIILAAARYRMERKAADLDRHTTARGESEALFCALAVALGYKRNQTPFLLLAQRAGVEASGGPDGESLLFGLSGFLETPEPPAAPRELRSYLRSIWEQWWRMRSSHDRWILEPGAWSLAGIRPANHPHRRIAALAGIARNWSDIHRAAKESQSSFERILATIAHPFWDQHFNLQAAALKSPQALIGAQRISDILINVWFPGAIRRDPQAWEAFLAERGPTAAARIQSTGRRLLGADADRLMRLAAIQQGLLQFEQDEAHARDSDVFYDGLRRIPPAAEGGLGG